MELLQNAYAIAVDAVNHYINSGNLVSHHTIKMLDVNATADSINRLATVTCRVIDKLGLTTAFTVSEQVDTDEASSTAGQQIKCIIITTNMPNEFTDVAAADILLKFYKYANKA